MKTGTTNRIFHPKNIVNWISQKLVVSIFGKKANAILHTSMTATIMPARAISFIDKIGLFFCINGINNFECVAVQNRLAIYSIVTILIIYVE